MVLNQKEVTEFALKNLEKEKNSEFYPRLERIERKLDAIIGWINRLTRDGSFKSSPSPVIDLDACERRNKDSQ